MNITLLYLLKHIIQLVQTISNNPITILKSFFLSYTIIIPFLKLISLDYNFIFLFFPFPFGLHVKTEGEKNSLASRKFDAGRRGITFGVTYRVDSIGEGNFGHGSTPVSLIQQRV